MNKKIEFNLKNIFIVGFSIITISVTGSYLSTSYALTENGYAVDSSNVEYQDNASLGVTNVQAAIDGTCTKFSNQLTNLKSDIIDTIYPVGSIYISTEDDTVEKVEEKFVGTWVTYGEGRTLIGVGSNGTSTYLVNQTGGSETHNHTALTGETTLAPENLPSRTVVFNKNEVINYSLALSYMQSATEGTWTWHALSSETNQNFGVPHTHSISSDSNIQPYTAVYMYKRTA